jgi:hypothetical protein
MNDSTDEIRCPFCNAILDERWVRKCGASLMGKAGGAAKARSTAQSSALKRWDKERAKPKGSSGDHES